MPSEMLPVSKMCARLGVCRATAYAAVARGELDSVVVKFRRVRYVTRVCADPTDFQLWVRTIGDYQNRGARMLRAFEDGVAPDEIAARFGIKVASVWRALGRRGIQKRQHQDSSARRYRGRA